MSNSACKVEIIGIPYIRISEVGNRDEDGTLTSDKAQLSEIRRHCASKGMTVAEDLIFVDKDHSAFTKPWRKRPGMVAAVDAIKRLSRPGVEYRIVGFKQDRLLRDIADLLDILKHIKPYGGEVCSTDMLIDPDTAQGEFMRTQYAAIAKMESQNISARVKSNARYRAEVKQSRHGGKCPAYLGYDKKTKAFSVIEDVAGGFRRMCQLRAEGKGFTAIAKTLNAEGWRKPSGAPWDQPTVYQWLEETWLDSMATGAQYFHRPNRRRTDARGNRIKQGDPVRVPSIYPAIITEELAEKCREVNARTAGVKGERVRADYNDNYLLAGLLRCAECGQPWVSHAGRNGIKNYRCNGLGLKHSQSMVRREIVEDAVLRAAKWGLDNVTGRPKLAVVKKDTARVVAQLEEQIERVTVAFDMGGYTVDQFKARITTLKKQLEEAKAAKKDEDAGVKPLPTIVDGMSRSEVRDALRAFVQSVKFPYYDERVMTQTSKSAQTPRPMALVTVKYGKMLVDYYAPLYHPSYEGEKVVFTDDELYGDRVGDDRLTG